MNFCSHCGSARLTQRVPEGDTRLRYVCPDCHTIHYQNPRVVTGCLPVWEGRVLLCRRAIEPRQGLWNVPSGFLENGESVLEGALREVREEAAAEIRVDYLISLYNIERINQVYLQFVGELIDGAFGVGPESLESVLFDEADIPWDELAFTSSAFTLRKYFADRAAGLRRLHRSSFPDTGA